MTATTVSTVAGLVSALSGAHAGDSILLAPGTYSGLSISNLNVAGGAVTITSQNSANPAILTGLSVSSSSGLNFSGLDVISPSPVNYLASVGSSSNVNFSNILFEGSNPTAVSDAGGLSFWHSTGVSVTNSTFESLGGVSGAALNVTGGDNVTVSGNAFFNMGGDGMDVAGASDITVSNNSFTDFLYSPGFHADAIQFWNAGTTGSAQNITISGNVITRGAGLTLQGIFIEDDSNGTQPYLNLKITGNTTVGIPYNAISVGGPAGDPDVSTGAVMSGNTVTAYTDYTAWLGIWGSINSTVTNNAAASYSYNGDTGLTQSGNTVNAPIAPPSPTLANAGSAVTYHGGGAAAAVAPSLSVADYGSTILESASVAITGGFLAGDSLNFANQHGISGSYNASNGVLTLSGMATLANYQAALDSITYSSSVADPTNAGADIARTITFSANDGAHGSHALAASVTVTAPPPASPPSLSNTGSAPTYQAGGSAQNVAQSLAVTDTAASTLWSASVAITNGFVAGDSLNFANQSGITGSYNASTGVLTLSGAASVANYQAALDSITFSTSDYMPKADPYDGAPDPSRAVSFTVNDGFQNSNSAAANVAVTAAASAPQPTLANAGSTSTYQAGGAAAVVAQQLAVTDTNSTTLASASVAISSGFIVGDALAFSNQGGITGSYNASAGVLTLTGSASLAAYQAALDSITFSSSAADPTHAPPADPTDGGPDPLRAVTFTVNDGHSANSLVADVAITNPAAAAMAVAAAPVVSQAAVASATLVPIASDTTNPVVTASSQSTTPVANTAPAVTLATTSTTLDTAHLLAISQSQMAGIGVGGVGSIGSGAFILSPVGTQASGQTSAAGALASGAATPGHLDPTGLGALTPAVQIATVSPVGSAGMVGDSLVLHQTDFVIPMLGGHSLASAHAQLT